jgi:hypothetical protein
MSTLTIPLTDGTNQVFNVKIDDKECRLKIFESNGSLYMDFTIKNESSVFGQICRNLLPVNIDPKKRLKSKIYFQDTQDSKDPILDGLGIRYFLRLDNGVS